MSVRVMTRVWELALPDSQKIVLLALADCANDEGHCWPSMRTLALKCSKSERTVQGVIIALVEAGHLTRREVPGKGCNYTVHPRSEGRGGGVHYLYRIEHKETGQFYIGARSCECPAEKDDYWGSGNWVKRQDRADLTKEILDTYASRDELADAEAAVTARYFSDPLCMNMKVATPGTLAPQKSRPAAAAPRSERQEPPQGLRDTPAAAADKPSMNRKEPSTTRQRVKGKTIIPDDWKVPAVADLPPKARALAEQWTRASYETHAEAFHGYWRSCRRMNADWLATWANRVVSLHSQVMRDQKFGNAPTDAPPPVRQANPDLKALYARYQAGEISAAEFDRERDQLTRKKAA